MDVDSIIIRYGIAMDWRYQNHNITVLNCILKRVCEKNKAQIQVHFVLYFWTVLKRSNRLKPFESFWGTTLKRFDPVSKQFKNRAQKAPEFGLNVNKCWFEDVRTPSYLVWALLVSVYMEWMIIRVFASLRIKLLLWKNIF